MPARKEYTPEFKDQAVRFVLEEIEPDESPEHACERLAPKLSVKAVTLYNWLKQSAPGKARTAVSPGSVDELRALNSALRKENRELAGRTRSCRTRQLFSGRRSTAKGGSRVRGCSSSSRGRADLSHVAGRPGTNSPAHRSQPHPRWGRVTQ